MLLFLVYVYSYIGKIQINVNYNSQNKKKCVFSLYIGKTQPTPKQNVIYLYIRKIQLTSGQKEKKKRDFPIQRNTIRYIQYNIYIDIKPSGENRKEEKRYISNKR